MEGRYFRLEVMNYYSTLIWCFMIPWNLYKTFRGVDCGPILHRGLHWINVPQVQVVFTWFGFPQLIKTWLIRAYQQKHGNRYGFYNKLLETKLGGGFKHFFFSPWSLGKWSNLTNSFGMGWFNHQPEQLTASTRMVSTEDVDALEVWSEGWSTLWHGRSYLSLSAPWLCGDRPLAWNSWDGWGFHQFDQW